MEIEDFDYSLPSELIAQQPLAERDSSRMMIVNRATQSFTDSSFRQLPQVLASGDLLVFNNTRVIPARLLGHRKGLRSQRIGRNNPARGEYLTAEIELFLTRPEGEDVWQALVRPGRKVRTGEILVFGDGELEAEVLGRGQYGLRRVQLKASVGRVDNAIDRLGRVPLPPYIHRSDTAADREAYQTIFARHRGAIAAPTAGLHFTSRVLAELDARGIEHCELTLHVGLGTFQPVHEAQVEKHHMEPEHYEAPETAANAINRALDDGRRVIAVGTTMVRTLESIALTHQARIIAGGGETGLFILPGYEFRATKALLTNFHLPRSTLLMLVAAFAGRDLILRAYDHAVRERYRFYSYGDCMLIL
jgi:S-adenosylmethionine:tRNA ribosyltransferase-isomerase